MSTTWSRAISRLMLTDDAARDRSISATTRNSPFWNWPKKSSSYTNSRSKLVFKPLPQDDPRQRQPDLSKAKTLLGWEPKVALADGLKETVAYFKRSLELS